MSHKILHISTKDNGGAGLAAIRLHQAMLDQGLESRFLCLEQTSATEGVEVFPKFYPRFYNRFLERVGIYTTHNQRNQHRLKEIQQAIDPEMYSFPETDYEVHAHQAVTWAEVILIHWAAGFLNLKTFFRNIPPHKQVFWYTHDFNLILGGFHTLFDADRFHETSIKAYEKNLIQKKREYLSAFPNLQILANSEFSYKTVIKSRYFNEDRVHCVPLGLPQGELNPIEKSIAKQALGFNPNDFLVLTVSDKLSAAHKGMDRLREVLLKVGRSSSLKLLTLGSSPVDCTIKNIEMCHLGSLWQAPFKQIVFSAADVLLSTSYEESFGQTIIEGYACGTPALVFDNAALPELIEQGKTGFVAKSINEFSEYLLQMGDSILNTRLMGENALIRFMDNYTTEIQIQKLLDVIQ